MQSELRRRTLGEQIGLTFSLSADLFGPLFIITVVCALPGLVIQLTLMPDINAMQVGASMPMLMEQLESALIALGAALAQMLVTIPILEAAIAVIIRATYVGERPSVVAGFKLAMRRFGGMFLLKLGLSVILTLGFMLCLAPYFLFAAWFFVATPVLLFENRSWLDALPRARSLADGYTVEMLALFLLTTMAPGFILGLIILPVNLLLADYYYAQVVISWLMGIAVTIPVAVAPIVAYFNLRVSKESFDVKRLADFVQVIGNRGAKAPA
jgi:hypothetical protein